MGRNWSDSSVIDSYAEGSVTGSGSVGGLVGSHSFGSVANSYYDHNEVLVNGKKVITVGALLGEDFGQWLANGKSLDVDDRLSQEHGYYLINNVSDLKELLAFGQDSSLRFRLASDLDLATEVDFYIPYLAGQFDGNGHRISDLNLSLDFVAQTGLFGVLASGGEISAISVVNAKVTGTENVGGLVGRNDGTVSGSCFAGSVIGYGSVGGLVGVCSGAVRDSYASGSVTGESGVGGLVALCFGTVNNSHYDYEELRINGKSIITIGALSAGDFEQWLANDKFLDVNQRLSQDDSYYVINDVSDFRSLLAFGQDSTLRFRLNGDIDLGNDLNFYIPYLAGEFDGAGHIVANLSFTFDFVMQVGLFGYLHHSARVAELGVEGVNLTGSMNVGGLVGDNNGGSVSRSYSTGSVTGGDFVGGLIGVNRGNANNSYSTCNVSGDWAIGGLMGAIHGGTVSNSYSAATVTGRSRVGGLAGELTSGTVSKCYSSGSVTGDSDVGGLLGINFHGTVSNSFWDVQTSGMEESNGGTGKTTAEMQSIGAFSGAGWDITAVANPGVRNTAYIWNMVDGETYPFLSWESVS